MSEPNSETPLLQREIELMPMGEGDELRTRNEGPDDWERDNVIERTDGSIKIFCDLMEVKHGTLSLAEEGKLATLIVFRFRFDADEGRRILRANLAVEFFPSQALGLTAIAPFQRWSILSTTDNEQTVSGGDLTDGVSGLPFLTMNSTARLEKTVSRDTKAATTVSGVTELPRGKSAGRRTRAVWKLAENPKRRTGVPDSMSVAVILNRDSDDAFTAEVEIDTRADPRTGLGRLFRRLPLDDPVLFNPRALRERPMQDLVRSNGVENLENVDLYSYVKTSMTPKAFWFDQNEE